MTDQRLRELEREMLATKQIGAYAIAAKRAGITYQEALMKTQGELVPFARAQGNAYFEDQQETARSILETAENAMEQARFREDVAADLPLIERLSNLLGVLDPNALKRIDMKFAMQEVPDQMPYLPPSRKLYPAVQGPIPPVPEKTKCNEYALARRLGLEALAFPSLCTLHEKETYMEKIAICRSHTEHMRRHHHRGIFERGDIQQALIKTSNAYTHILILTDIAALLLLEKDDYSDTFVSKLAFGGGQ